MINSFQEQKKNNFNKINQNALFFWCQHLLLPKKVSIFPIILLPPFICSNLQGRRESQDSSKNATNKSKRCPKDASHEESTSLVVCKWHSPLPYFGTIPLLLWHSLSYKVAGAVQVMSRQGYCTSWSPPNKRGKAADWSSVEWSSLV